MADDKVRDAEVVEDEAKRLVDAHGGKGRSPVPSNESNKYEYTRNSIRKGKRDVEERGGRGESRSFACGRPQFGDFSPTCPPGHVGAIVDIPKKGRIGVMKNIPHRWHVILGHRCALCRSAAKANKGADQVLPVAASSISNNPLTKLTLVGRRLTSVTSHLFGNRGLVLPSDFAVTNGLMTDGRDMRTSEHPLNLGLCRYNATNNERPHLLVFHFLDRGDTFIKVNVRLGVCPRFSLRRSLRFNWN